MPDDWQSPFTPGLIRELQVWLKVVKRCSNCHRLRRIEQFPEPWFVGAAAGARRALKGQADWCQECRGLPQPHWKSERAA